LVPQTLYIYKKDRTKKCFEEMGCLDRYLEQVCVRKKHGNELFTSDRC
jgi:hypothetical protein